MEDKMDRLKGKVIIISGGARGQGAAEARLFAGEGARVVIGDVLEPEGRQLASELGPAAAFVRHDVTQATDWETAVNAAEKLGGLHGLVNNAGIYQPRTLMETETELFERHTRQSTRLLPRDEGRGVVDGAVGRRVNRQYIIGCRPPRIPRCDRLQRYEMGVEGDDQSGSNRSGTAQDPSKLGAPLVRLTLR